MSRIITNNLRHNDATADSLSFDSSGNVSVSNDLAVNTDTLFVDASADRVGIGTSSPAYDLVVANDNTSTLQILSGGSTNLSRLLFADANDIAIGRINYDHSDNSMQLFANNSERLRIASDGTLQLRNSPGIDFSQIQTNAAGMTSELLDSYEEGTWTPVLSEEGGSPTIGYGFRNGRYVKVGSSVMIYGTIRVNSLSGSGSNPIKISGFPFSISSSSTTLVTSLDVGLIAGSWSSNFPGRIYWREGQTSAYVGISNSSAVVVGTNLTSTSEIGFSGCYTTGLT